MIQIWFLHKGERVPRVSIILSPLLSWGFNNNNQNRLNQDRFHHHHGGRFCRSVAFYLNFYKTHPNCLKPKKQKKSGKRLPRRPTIKPLFLVTHPSPPPSSKTTSLIHFYFYILLHTTASSSPENLINFNPIQRVNSWHTDACQKLGRVAGNIKQRTEERFHQRKQFLCHDI